ncbi:DoxX family protein [Nocardia sp. NPDC101769]|uniref:DoxX family protein n=1 Tax=Nocardia sp. NPDC101769 TaxID=3364333 RepID=UPI003808354D
MNIALWICAGLLAAVALFGGLTKIVVPKEKLAAAPGGGWTGDATATFVTTLGGLEVLAALGLTLPAVLDTAPFMVPVTAVCWILLMIGAMITHLGHGDRAALTANVLYLALALFIAVDRFWLHPF